MLNYMKFRLDIGFHMVVIDVGGISYTNSGKCSESLIEAEGCACIYSLEN